MLFRAVFACLESRISRVLGFKAQVVGSLLEQKRMERFLRSRSSIPYDCASPQCANPVGTVVDITRDGRVHIKFVVLDSFTVDNFGAEHKWMQKRSIEESEICERV
jgi:hypothetical protein